MKEEEKFNDATKDKGDKPFKSFNEYLVYIKKDEEIPKLPIKTKNAPEKSIGTNDDNDKPSEAKKYASIPEVTKKNSNMSEELKKENPRKIKKELDTSSEPKKGSGTPKNNEDEPTENDFDNAEGDAKKEEEIL